MSTRGRARRGSHRAAPVLFALLVALGCSDGSAQRRGVLEDASAVHLAGMWNLTLRLDRPMTLSTDARSLPRIVSGTVALLENRNAQLSFSQLRAPTHMGVYDIDLRAIGVARRDGDVVPGVVAGGAATPIRSSARADGDSVYIVLNPETPRHVVQLTGIITGDSAIGVWIAESFLGGGGTFTLRRVPR